MPSTTTITAAGTVLVTLALIGAICYLTATKAITGGEAMTFFGTLLGGAGGGGLAIAAHNAGVRAARDG